MGRDTFNDARTHLQAYHTTEYRPDGSWCVFAGFDERGYALLIQKAADDREPMVKVGCRFLTLKVARAHYVSRSRNWSRTHRRTAAQMLQLIGIGVATAKHRGWITSDVKFNTMPRRVSVR